MRPWTPPNSRRILLSAVAAVTVTLGVMSLIAGFSDSLAIRLVQGLAVFGLGAGVVGGAVVLALLRLAAWREPQSEREFEALVERSERLAAGGEDWAELEDWEPDLEDDPGYYLDDDEDFRQLVRAALDDLPLEFHRALEHVAIVVSDGGRQRRAYGLYQGDTVARDHFHDRIVIFKDTLVRDFGHNPTLLRAQVTRTVRHELAHHLGWDENGVRGLGL
ncbi:MAG TPA: metallopeptidase family protein [Solirubrobacteraceae bacterium]|jgi:predicted Zn-dependent protease with MMP-like domain|nr:metallopeptidase family protein [Solirubrobacteraceae bacterium]